MRARSSLAIAAVSLIAACGDGQPPLTSGERIGAGRDFDTLWFWRPSTLVYTRAAASGGGGQDLWVRELDEADPRLALPDVDFSVSGWPRAFADRLLVTGPTYKLAYDFEAHLAETIPQGNLVVAPDGRALARWGEPLLIGDVVRIGPLQGEHDIQGFTTRAAAFMGDDLAAIGRRTQDDPGVQWLVRLSPADDRVRLLPVGMPYWTLPAGHDPLADECGSLWSLPCPMFQVLGCDDATPACPETGERPCAIAFARDLPQTDPPQFAPAIFDVNLEMEVPVDGNFYGPGAGFVRSPDGRRTAWTDQTSLYIWDACTRRTFRCDVASPQQPPFIGYDSWRPDSGALVAGSDGKTLHVMSAEDGSCGAVTTNGWRGIFFSPASDRMGWIDLPDDAENGTLWIADGLGQGAMPLALGNVAHGGFSDDSRFVFVERTRDVSISLSVVDLQAAAPVERPLAFATTFALRPGARRLLALTHWNSQDQSGQIELFDLVRQTSTVLAEAVTGLAVAGSVDDAVSVAYTVRTRAPTASDGLWLVTLPAAGAP